MPRENDFEPSDNELAAIEPNQQEPREEDLIADEHASFAVAHGDAAEPAHESLEGPLTGDEPAVAQVPEEPPVEPQLPLSTKMWYIIHTYSGFEQKVAESLRSRGEAFGFGDKVGAVLIPTEEVVELRNGKKVTSKRMLYPGYLMIEMDMDDELWHHVKNTPRVTGFVGGGNSPVPLSADEVNRMLYREANPAEAPRPKITFEKSETVRIIDGPFMNFSGKVEEINPERGTLRVMVTIFGRATPVELEFLQVEKI